MDRLEQSYKEKLIAFESDFSPQVWENISSALGARRRRRLLIYMIAALAIIALLLLSILINSKKAQQEEKKPDTVIALNPEMQNKLFFFNDSAVSELTKNDEAEEILRSDSRTPVESISFIQTETAVYKTYLSGKPSVTPLLFESKSEENQNEDHKASETVKLANQINSFFNHGYKNEQAIRDERQLTIIVDMMMSGNKKYGYKADPDDCFRTESDNWFIEVNAAPAYGLKSLSGSNNSLLNLRKDSENPWLSYSVGAKIGYDIRGTIVRTGFDYTAHNEKFRHVVKNVLSTQTVITIDTIRHSDGTYSITRDTTVKEIFGEEQIRKINSYRMIGIPLIVGYEFRSLKHSFGLNAGFIINLLLNKRGFILDENGKIEDLSEMGDRVFLKNTGVSLYSSVMYSYSPNGRYAFFAEPRFVYNISPMTRSEYPLNQKLYNFGVSLGARYLF